MEAGATSGAPSPTRLVRGAIEQAMSTELWLTLVSAGLAGFGFLIAKFWIAPIIRYREIKREITSNLIRYANAIELQKTTGEFRTDSLERKNINRKNAADLKAVHNELPYLYRMWLRKRNENPVEAHGDLIGLSNESDREEAKHYIAGIKRHLRIS